MTRLKWWMRVVGVFYLFQAVIAAIVRLPIRVMGPEGVLAAASAGDPTAKLLVDTWVMFGLDLVAIGAALLIASRMPEQARVLVWTVIGVELVRGIGIDIYMIARGYEPTAHVIWIVIHSVFIVTGLVSLRSARSTAWPAAGATRMP